MSAGFLTRATKRQAEPVRTNFSEKFAEMSGILSRPLNQGPLNGGEFQTGGFDRSGNLSFLFCPFLSFLGDFPIFPGFSRFARDFPDLLGETWSGEFPRFVPFLPSRPIKSTYEEPGLSKGSATQSGPFPKTWETPRFGNTPV